MNTAVDQHLRPLTLGEILDRTVQVYRHNFVLFAGVAALPVAFSVVLLIPAVAILALPGIPRSGGMHLVFVPGLTFAVYLLAAIPVYLAAYVYSAAGLTMSAVSAQRGEKPTIRGALAKVPPRFFTYLWFLVLQAVVVALVPAAVAGGIIGALVYSMSLPGASMAEDFGLGFLAFLVGAAAVAAIAWLALGYSIGMAVCVVEQKPAWESLTRAWQLSEGTRGRIFVLFLMVVVLSMVVSMASYMISLVVATMAAVLGKSALFAAAAAVIAGLLYALASIGGQILLTPVSWIALVLFYYDQRVRKEGFDIEWMMQRAGLVQEQDGAGLSQVLNQADAQPANPTAANQSLPNFGPAPPPDTVEER
jgi:hypothetical protein